MKEKKKHAPPLRCRIRSAIVTPSPSAIAWCGLGLRRTTRSCEGCQENRGETAFEAFQAGMLAGQAYLEKIRQDGKSEIFELKAIDLSVLEQATEKEEPNDAT